jgi:uncharacterized OB-fold protein
MADYAKPLPRPDADSRPFWESCKAHAMALQQCAACGRFRYPPRLTCPHCLSEDARWTPVSGRGQVFLSLVMHRPYGPAWEGDVPYNVAMIELDEGVRLWSNVVGCDPDAVQIGDRVQVSYDDVTPEFTLPRFRRVPDS